MKLPELSTWFNRLAFVNYLNQVLPEEVETGASDEEIEAAWNALDEDQQRGVYELFSVELFRRLP